MPKHAISFRIMARDGAVPELLGIWDRLFEDFEREPTTELYVLNQSLRDPNELWCYEVFTSRDDYRAHRRTPTVDETLPRLRELVTEFESIPGVPLRAKGLAIQE